MYIWKKSSANWFVNSSGWIAQDSSLFSEAGAKVSSFGNIPYRFSDGTYPKNVRFSDGNYVWQGWNCERYNHPDFNYLRPTGTYTFPTGLCIPVPDAATNARTRNCVLKDASVKVTYAGTSGGRNVYKETWTYLIAENGKSVTYDPGFNYSFAFTSSSTLPIIRFI